jgi:hypothetical protein
VRPSRPDIAAPELPQRVRWLNGDPGSMAELTAAGPVLVHFFDFAQLNSVRTLPYVREWHSRYGDAGLTVLGIHSPRFAFTRARKALEPGIDRLGIAYPVAQDSAYAIWRDYGARGWPSLFLWSGAGALAYYHFGEGEYRATEEAIQAELRALDATAPHPEPMAPLRASDAPGALVAAPSEELFPGGSPQEPWRSSPGTPGLEVHYAAGGAYAALDGEGELAVALDGEEGPAIALGDPGLYALAEHERHEAHRLELTPGRGVELYAVSFAAGVPA